jgi:hypothetical protein
MQHFLKLMVEYAVLKEIIMFSSPGKFQELLFIYTVNQ